MGRKDLIRLENGTLTSLIVITFLFAVQSADLQDNKIASSFLLRAPEAIAERSIHSRLRLDSPKQRCQRNHDGHQGANLARERRAPPQIGHPRSDELTHAQLKL